MIIDVVMLSYCKNQELFDMTYNALNSLNDSATKNEFAITLVETNRDLLREPFFKDLPENVGLLFPGGPFNYNKYMKAGLRHGSNKYVLMLNNDIICHKGFSEKLAHELNRWHSVSPAGPLNPLHKELKGPIEAYRTSYYLCGWAIMTRRYVFELMGGIDTVFPDALEFWYSDNYYADKLQFHGLKHALITEAHLDHLESKSHSIVDDIYSKTHGAEKIYKELRRNLR
jgi:hypothetical protein